MQITSSAVSLNVADVAAASAFLTDNSGFTQVLAADGFCSLARGDCPREIVLLRRWLATLPADQRDDGASGVILAFVVEELEAECARL